MMNFVSVTFQEKEGDLFTMLRSPDGQLYIERQSGPDQLNKHIYLTPQMVDLLYAFLTNKMSIKFYD